MDLLATVKKSGSRGGTGDFKWSDVQTSSHREHYLGHSLMAPVGRWQKGRDLNWYVKGETENDDESETPEEKAARQRADEIRAVKEAEQDALARALGLPVPDRSNPNTQVLGNRKDVERVVKEMATDDGRGSKGLGFGGFHPGRRESVSGDVERLEGDAEQQEKELEYALKEYKRRQGHKSTPRRRSRSRSHDRDRRPHHKSRDEDRQHRPHHHHHHHHHHRRRRSRSSSSEKDTFRRKGPSQQQSRRSRGDRSRSPRRRNYDRKDLHHS